jgi:hypothetical protein
VYLLENTTSPQPMSFGQNNMKKGSEKRGKCEEIRRKDRCRGN